MSSKSEYILKMIADLPEEQRNDMLADLLSEPNDSAGQIEFALMSDYTEEAIEYFKNFGQMQGLSTGYLKLDELTKGLVPGELTVLAGKTSHGKTGLAINIANNIALKGKTVLFVTLEMTQREITSRFMQINGGPDTPSYQTSAALTILQSSNELNWHNIDFLVENAKTEMNVDLVVIDHLHYFTRELEHVAEDLGRITKELKKNAIRHGVAIILISHVRKTQKPNAVTSIDDLRGSSYIAQDADVVLMVNRSRTAPNELTVTIEKNRNRGFDYQNDEARLYVDKIKIYNDKVDAIFPEGSTQENGEQPVPKVLPF